MINFSLLFSSLPDMLKAAQVSFSITVLSFSIGIALGFFIACIRLYGGAVFSHICSAYVSIVRGTPMIVQISMYFYILPLLGVKINPFTCAVLALGLCSAAYLSEIFRAGILSVPKGYFEASYTLGFSRLQTMRHVVMPYVLRVILPAIGNELVTLSKDSSLASTIGVLELYKRTIDIARFSYDYITMLFGLSCFYIVWTMFLSYCFSRLEKKYKL